MIKTKPDLVSLPKPGELVEGEIIEKGSKMIFVDLKKYGIGAVYGGEIKNAKETVRPLKIGDRVHAKVVDLDNEDGFVELSIADADKQKAWAKIIELAELEEPIKVKTTGFNKGGLTVEIQGLKAFLPVSQLSAKNYPEVPYADKTKIASALEKLVGEELSVKIIDANPRKEKFIISERAANEINIKELAKGYEVDQIIEGIISGVADFGAFIKFADNPQVEGLIHVSELSHRKIENPKELIGVDKTVKAKIIEIKDGKIFLSIKALLPDPWKDIGTKYKENKMTEGKVYSFNPFGAIIDLENDIQGQIHITEFGSTEEMKKQLEIGKKYNFQIKSIQPENKKIDLKIITK